MDNSSVKLEVETDIVAKAPLSAEFRVGNWHVKPMLNRIESTAVNFDAAGCSATEGARSLEPRLMHLLCFLAANAGHVLSREQLVQELWPDVIVNENSLTRAVSALRKQLAAAHGKAGDYIETIPKKGYRLTAKLSPINSVHSFETVTAVDPDSKLQPVPAGKLRLALRPTTQQTQLFATACLCLLVSLWLWQPASMPGGAAATLIPVTTASLSDELIRDEQSWTGGQVRLSNSSGQGKSTLLKKSFVVSNDEQRFAYIQHNNDTSTIFVASVENLATAYPVFTSNEKLYNLRWSPVGEALLFASKQKMTSTALFSTSRDPARLMMVDINTLEAVELLREELDSESSEVMSLT